MQANALTAEAVSLFSTMSAAKMYAVVQFARFIAQQPEEEAAPAKAADFDLPEFGSLRDRFHYIAPDFDEPLEDFKEYM